MAELFDTTPPNVVTHLGNVFSDKELEEPATSKDFLIVQIEGRRRIHRPVKHYNLDAIISVGHRVNSRRGVRFRQWATTTLREYLVRGYTLNRQRFEDNARELESALVLVCKATSGEALTTDQGRRPLDIRKSPSPVPPRWPLKKGIEDVLDILRGHTSCQCGGGVSDQPCVSSGGAAYPYARTFRKPMMSRQ